MSTSKKKIIKIPKLQINFQDLITTFSDNIIYYDIESKGLLNLIRFNKKSLSKNSKTGEGRTWRGTRIEKRGRKERGRGEGKRGGEEGGKGRRG